MTRPTTTPRAKRAPRTQAPIDIGALTCPRCKHGKLMTGARGWGCARWREGCRFVVWFETAGTRLTPRQLHALITKGKTGRLVLDPERDGGVVRSGNTPETKRRSLGNKPRGSHAR